MREILFRGKRIDNGEWVEGHYGEYMLMSGESIPCISIPNKEAVCGSTCYDVEASTVGQYTGQTDKNGKKIFEGDCFKTYCTGLPVYKHIVGYYPEHFAFMARCIEMNAVHYLSDYRPSAIEVIGNIRDNPELLEVDK